MEEGNKPLAKKYFKEVKKYAKAKSTLRMRLRGNI